MPPVIIKKPKILYNMNVFKTNYLVKICDKEK